MSRRDKVDGACRFLPLIVVLGARVASGEEKSNPKLESIDAQGMKRARVLAGTAKTFSIPEDVFHLANSSFHANQDGSRDDTVTDV